MKEKPKEKIKYPLVTDKELWQKFKSVCATKGVSMISIIEESIKKYILENK